MMANNKQEQGKLNREFGKFAEDKAAEYLLANGYTIRERNIKFRTIEIDIIAEIGNTIAFVEVKARRGDRQDPIDAVDYKKQRKMVSGADIYLKKLPILYSYRFDIITITGSQENYQLQHYPDAFMPSLGSRLH